MFLGGGRRRRVRGLLKAPRAALYGGCIGCRRVLVHRALIVRYRDIMSSIFDELKATLPSMPFFGGLHDKALASVISMLRERVFKADDIVFREGQLGHSMYIIHTGTAIACRAGDSGHNVRLVRFGPGSFFGDMELIEVQPRSMTITAETPLRLFELTSMNLLRLYESDIEAYVMVVQNIAREMCRRLRRADRRIVETADKNQDDTTQIRDISAFSKRS